MSRFIVFTMYILSLTLMISSCKKDPEIDVIIKGCKDALADNYNKDAEEEDGSCTYQNRFISKYDVNILCGAASAIFKDATMEITANAKIDRVNFLIGSIAGNIVFDGIITTSTVKIDTIIKDLVVNAKNINSGFPDQNVKADVTMNSLLTLSSDAKTLSGDMDVKIKSNENIVIGSAVIPAGTAVEDKCTFKGTKK